MDDSSSPEDFDPMDPGGMEDDAINHLSISGDSADDFDFNQDISPIEEIIRQEKWYSQIPPEDQSWLANNLKILTSKTEDGSLNGGIVGVYLNSIEQSFGIIEKRLQLYRDDKKKLAVSNSLDDSDSESLEPQSDEISLVGIIDKSVSHLEPNLALRQLRLIAECLVVFNACCIIENENVGDAFEKNLDRDYSTGQERRMPQSKKEEADHLMREILVSVEASLSGRAILPNIVGFALSFIGSKVEGGGTEFVSERAGMMASDDESSDPSYPSRSETNSEQSPPTLEQKKERAKRGNDHARRTVTPRTVGGYNCPKCPGVKKKGHKCPYEDIVMLHRKLGTDFSGSKELSKDIKERFRMDPNTPEEDGIVMFPRKNDEAPESSEDDADEKTKHEQSAGSPEPSRSPKKRKLPDMEPIGCDDLGETEVYEV